jgi:hypothetical protein
VAAQDKRAGAFAVGLPVRLARTGCGWDERRLAAVVGDRVVDVEQSPEAAFRATTRVEDADLVRVG